MRLQNAVVSLVQHHRTAVHDVLPPRVEILDMKDVKVRVPEHQSGPASLVSELGDSGSARSLVDPDQ